MKDFIPYEQALALKELGFDEPCFGYHGQSSMSRWLFPKLPNEVASDDKGYVCSAPLYQQAFRWLYQRLSIENGTMLLDTESQQLLLKELIDKVSSKHLLV